MSHPSEMIQSLRNQIKDADGYLPISPEYNRSTSSAMKNTLDYFLEEYYFKPSAIVSYPQDFLAESMQPNNFDWCLPS
jgi:NAD(P)H-dependent FMN reductase